MKRIVIVTLTLVVLIGMLPFNAFAVSKAGDTNVVRFDDGAYMEISIDTSSARVANTVSGSKTYTYYDSDGNVEWKATLSATFAYSGSWYTCTTANCNVTIYDDKWYVISNTTTRSSNNATTQLTMGKKYLGVTTAKPQYTITLTCDNNGNLS